MDQQYQNYTNLYENARQTSYQQPYTQAYTQDPVKPMKKKGTGKRVAAFCGALVLCGGIGFGGGYLGSVVANRNNAPTIITQAAAPTGQNSTTTNANTLDISQVAAAATPSVVEVRTEVVTTNSFFGQYVTGGAGSGVIISQDGYIITNNHVISGASQITVTLNDKSQYPATLIGTDAQTDIAVLKIDATDLPAAIIGDSSSLVVGEFTLAVGNPLGTLGGTVTDGIISALDRDVTIDKQTMTLLQTNAAVSPGNSGGGLFNARGELIGVVNAKSSASNVEGIGFAIPIDTAMRVAQDLISTGYVTGRPALGVSVLAITDQQTAAQYGVTRAGVYLTVVNDGSAAAQAGLQVGDMLVSVDGTVVNSTADVTSILSEHSVGDTVEVQIVRDNQMVTVNVTLQESAAGSAQQSQQQSAPSEEQGSNQQSGFDSFEEFSRYFFGQ